MQRLGEDFLIVDDQAAAGASRVAAGLLAPVGGKRLGLAWRAAEAWPRAIDFYREVVDLVCGSFME